MTQQPVSTQSRLQSVAIPTGAADSDASVLAALLETTKPGITRLVTITALFGFAIEALASRELALGDMVVRAVVVVLGAGLASAGANALNMWMEPERDALMPRTASRPLPTGILTPKAVLSWGLLLATAGVLILLLFAGPAAGLVGLAGVALYVLVYTPLKPVTVWNTLIGAFPGAVPPLIGAAAATQASGFEPLARPIGWSLFAIMVVWQLPHFLAIAWKYRDEYAKAGYRMLPSVDSNGAATVVTIVITSALLVAVSFLPILADSSVAGPVYAAVAGLTGLAYLWLAFRLARKRTDTAAKTVFFASIAHLPILMFVLLAEAALRTLVLA
ncbi:MAG: heme o synthase [Planctomycetota bacterium]